MQTLKVCVDHNLVDGSRVIMDGSLVKADAALKSLVERTDQDLSKGNDLTSRQERSANRKLVSTTDPDSTLAGKFREVKQLRYKVHTTADSKSRGYNR